MLGFRPSFGSGSSGPRGPAAAAAGRTWSRSSAAAALIRHSPAEWSISINAWQQEAALCSRESVSLSSDDGHCGCSPVAVESRMERSPAAGVDAWLLGSRSFSPLSSVQPGGGVFERRSAKRHTARFNWIVASQTGQLHCLSLFKTSSGLCSVNLTETSSRTWRRLLLLFPIRLKGNTWCHLQTWTSDRNQMIYTDSISLFPRGFSLSVLFLNCCVFTFWFPASLPVMIHEELQHQLVV